MESTLFVPAKLTFSENLKCLNLPLLVGAVSLKRSLSWTCSVFAGQSVNSRKFKHLKYSENVNFAGTNKVDSSLAYHYQPVCIYPCLLPCQVTIKNLWLSPRFFCNAWWMYKKKLFYSLIYLYLLTIYFPLLRS